MWPVPPNLADAVRPISIASEQLLSAPNRGRRHEGETLPDATALMHYMASNRNTFGLAQFAADSTPRIELRDNYHNAFTLLIGDTFNDRLAFWNLRSRDPVFLAREPCSLIVSSSRLEDPMFFEALLEFLKKRNGVPRDSGPPFVTLCSTSLTTNQFEDVLQRFSTADRWNSYHVSPTITMDSITPSKTVLEHAQRLVTGGFFQRAPELKEFSASGQTTQPPAILPQHLSNVQGNSFATSGSWALDVTIERQENHSRYSNVRHSWYFTRRLRFHQAFLGSYESTHAGREDRRTRADAKGALSLFAGFGEELPSITIPSDETALRYAIQNGDTWPPFRKFDPWPHTPQGPFAWAQPSDKGRYLIGTMRMFDGLQNAAAVLLHNYWKSIFEELGGAIGAVRREQIKDSIKKKVRSVTAGPADWDEDTWDRMTSLVAGEAHQVRIPKVSLTYSDLLERHQPYLAKEKAELSKDTGDDDLNEWIARVKRSLRESVQEQCARNILFQGYQWRCDTCLSVNWNDLAELRPELTCAICGTGKPAPVDEPWSFRLNGFLQDAMREHGLLALVWCLATLEARARSTFSYLGPHDLWKNYPETQSSTRRDNEADLICVVDGRVHLCEAKSSGRDIIIASLADVAKRLRPDVVTLAVMEPPSRRLAAKLDELKGAVDDTSIEVELITLHDRPDSDDAFLP